MLIVRFRRGNASEARIGLLDDDRIAELDVDSLAELWAMPLGELRKTLETAAPPSSHSPEEVQILAPIDGRTELWAAGVTYEISREARVEESASSGDVYAQVYDAERPEIFFKSAAWRVRGDGQAIAVRSDSTLDVPEPEVALVVNRFGEIVGISACNDVSSRSIEGANPLYLPQAKVYLGGCSLGPAIRPIWEVSDPYALTIELTVESGQESLWHGTASTAQLHRRFEELVEYLIRADIHPDGVVLTTGTCLVPPAPFTLEEGQLVRVGVEGVGTLSNPVVRGLAAMKAQLSKEGLA